MIKLLFTLLFTSASLFSTNPLHPKKGNMEEICPQEQVACTASEVYLDCEQIFPTQLRYSSENVQSKIEAIVRAKKAVWDETSGSWQLMYNDGKSVYGEEDAVPVVNGPYGYFLCDGHHHILASLHFGAQAIPARVIANFSSLDENAFWKEMEKKGWAYPYNILGERATAPKDFKLLQDDPNRFFAALIARKCGPDADLSASRGAEYPVWIKVGQDIPFIEFQIADALWKQGLRYEYSMGENPPAEFVEEARKILREAKIPGLRIVDERTHFSKLQLSLRENQK
jgi:hypothetical protein